MKTENKHLPNIYTLSQQELEELVNRIILHTLHVALHASLLYMPAATLSNNGLKSFQNKLRYLLRKLRRKYKQGGRY
jgi:hypothetical protein